MPASAPELKRLSVLLDEALGLDEPSRERWLQALDEADRPLEPALRRLLLAPASQAAAQKVDRGPVFTLPADDDDPVSFAAGMCVGPYRLLRPLGAGGMGEVWLSERADGALQRPVALKLPTLVARRALLVQRFARERDIVAALVHPHIARLYDAGTSDDGQPFLALEYVDGKAIDAWCEARGSDVAERIALLRQVMDAVQYAHAHLVIHRDLKPGNILIDADGRAMLLDFGIAKLLQADAATGDPTELTRLGGRAMSLHYAAPEQVTGEPVSIASDIWALGVLLHELIAGRRPFEAGHRGALEQAIVHADPPRASASGLAARLPRTRSAELDTIVAKALKKAPAQRYATVAAFADDLDRWRRGDVVLARPDSRWYRASKFLARHRVAVATAGSVAAVVLGTAVVALRQAQLAREQAATADAVQDFLQGIFHASSADQSDPQRARRRTAIELLEEGAVRIESALTSEPAAKIRVLRTLGEMFSELADPERSLAMYEQRIAIARQYGNRAEEAAARADRALGLTDLLRFGDAREELARVRAALERGDETALEVRASMHLAESVVRTHSVSGFSAESGLAEADRAVAAARAASHTKLLVAALRQRATALSLLGRPREAVPAVEEALAVVRHTPAAGIGAEVGLLWELADARADLGEAGAAESAYREAAGAARARHGETSPQAVWTQIVFVRFLVKQSRLVDAAQETDLAARMLQSWPPSAERDNVHLGLLRYPFDALMRLGRLSSAQALIATAETLTVDPAQNPEGAWYLLQRRAWLATERGDFAVAARSFDAAEALIDRHKLAAHAFINAHRAAQLRLAAARGQGAQALALWRQMFPDKPPDGDEALPAGDAALAGEALLAAGHDAAAARRCEAALAALATGPRRASLADHEADLQELLGRARLAAGDGPGASIALREAERLAQGLLDADAPRLARARAWLGLAQLAAGDRTAARALAGAAAAAYRRHEPLGPQYTVPLQRLRAGLRHGG